MLLGRARGVDGRDRRRGRRGEDRRRLDELRAVAAVGALEERSDERDVAVRREHPQLAHPEPVREDDHDLSDACGEARVEAPQRGRIVGIARAEHVEHRRGYVD